MQQPRRAGADTAGILIYQAVQRRQRVVEGLRLAEADAQRQHQGQAAEKRLRISAAASKHFTAGVKLAGVIQLLSVELAYGRGTGYTNWYTTETAGGHARAVRYKARIVAVRDRA